jgi:hypothetical protein
MKESNTTSNASHGPVNALYASRQLPQRQKKLSEIVRHRERVRSEVAKPAAEESRLVPGEKSYAEALQSAAPTVSKATVGKKNAPEKAVNRRRKQPRAKNTIQEGRQAAKTVDNGNDELVILPTITGPKKRSAPPKASEGFFEVVDSQDTTQRDAASGAATEEEFEDAVYGYDATPAQTLIVSRPEGGGATEADIVIHASQDSKSHNTITVLEADMVDGEKRNGVSEDMEEGDSVSGVGEETASVSKVGEEKGLGVREEQEDSVSGDEEEEDSRESGGEGGDDDDGDIGDDEEGDDEDDDVGDEQPAPVAGRRQLSIAESLQRATVAVERGRRRRHRSQARGWRDARPGPWLPAPEGALKEALE